MKKRKGFTPLERKNFLIGFTLIELLVVIAIIALLMAILTPVARRSRNQARAVVCQNNLKQRGTLLEMHVQENQGRLFYSISYINDIFTIDPKYLEDARNSKIRFCPMAVRKGNRPLYLLHEIDLRLEDSPYSHTFILLGFRFGTLGSPFESWAWETGNEDGNSPSIINGSYGLNIAFTNQSPSMGSYNLVWDEFAAYSAKGQSNIPVYLDSASPLSIFVWEGQKPAPTEEEEMSCCINRHNGGVNSLFLDWSVRKVGLKELWKLKWTPEFNTNGPWTKAGGVQPENWPPWMRGFKDY